MRAFARFSCSARSDSSRRDSTTLSTSAVVPKVAPSVVAAVLGLCFLLVLDPAALAAQQGPGASLPSQSMRPYAHVFWAYALAWALILGWVISIGRRWSRVEKDLEGGSGSE
ncbi:MAG: hypothetical protein ACOC8K_03655 [Gemmatimonadota bacterium]